VVFNFLFSNGDAHLKNFSLLETISGDYLLSPAYDLINTRLHVDDTDFALEGGLFTDGYQSEFYKRTGHPCAQDFLEFGSRIGVIEKRAKKIIQPFLQKQPLLEPLINRSFLTEDNKRGYLLLYQTRRNYLLG
jgi:serine/threonine-protein kinase HipA